MNVPEKITESDQGAIFARLSEKANGNSDMGLRYRLTYNLYRCIQTVTIYGRFSRLALQVSNMGIKKRSRDKVSFQGVLCWVEYKVWIVDAINSAMRICRTDMIHVQHRYTSFTHFLHSVGVE